MFRGFFFALITWFLCLNSQAQVKPNLSNDAGSTLNVLYRNDVSGLFYANSRGYGAVIRRGFHKTYKLRSFYEFDLQFLHHNKEVKSVGDGEERRRFVYGKVNSVMVLRGSYGLQHTLFGKSDLKAVEVRYHYSLGPLLALAKPYYVQVYRSVSGSNTSILVPVAFSTQGDATDSSKIAGRAPFSQGLNQLGFYPGVNAKFSISFEYANYTNLIRAIETGISFDFYPRALPIMLRNNAENFMLTFNVGLVFGKKWY